MRKVHKIYTVETGPVNGTKWRMYGEVRCDGPSFNTMEVTENDEEVTCLRCRKIMEKK